MRVLTMGVVGVCVLTLVAPQLACATLVDSNSIIQDAIEYYMQTDKSVYDLGENVEMLYRITNLGSEDVTFHFDDQVQHYFTVKQNEVLIWDEPKIGAPAGSEFTLPPGGYKEYSEIWDMLDNQGILIAPGTYEITGSLHPVLLSEQDKNRYVPISVQIDIIPEPATLVLLGTGLTSLLVRNRRK